MRNLFVFTVVLGMAVLGANAEAQKKKQGKAAVADQPMIEEIGPEDQPKPMNAQRVAPVETAKPTSAYSTANAEATAEVVAVEPEPQASEPRPSEAPRKKTTVEAGKFPVGPVILGSVGVVAIVIGAGTGWQADQEYDMYQEKRSNYYPNATNKLADDIKLHTAVANAMMITGLVVVAGSVVWGVVEGVLNKKKQEKEQQAGLSARWRPAVKPNGTGVTVQF